MKKDRILIYAGTTEGRKLASYLVRKGVSVHVCVATSYGASLLPKEGDITVSHERMDRIRMKEFISDYRPAYVVDATHPYAKEVTANLKAACEALQIPYLRLVREEEETSGEICVEDVNAAVRYLEHTEGNILVTTGSKELEAFTKLTDYKERIYARVLSLKQVVEKCEELGVAGRHLICMQGPFSTEMNLAMLREYEIAYMVTKESGAAGGFLQKCEAAEEAGVRLVVIGRPEKEKGYEFGEICRLFKKELDLNDNKKVAIIGIGTGAVQVMTGEAKEAIKRADLLIGAGRMLRSAAGYGRPVYEEYLPEKILEYIKMHPEYEQIAVLLSGDCGFYSGAKKLTAMLKEEPEIEVTVLPGISSVSYLAAKLGVSWEDAFLTSSHGRKANLISDIREHQKVFALVSGKKEIHEILEQMIVYGYGDLGVCIGTELSYPTERIQTGTARTLLEDPAGSLAVLYIENPNGGKQPVVPGIPDAEFIRGEVPMTKEEVRTISLSKLRIRSDSVIYDIGAGTGSVSVEAAIQAEKGHVYAVERKQEAIELIQRNQKKMHVDNLTAIAGEAPDALLELPVPDRVFIGGSSGHLREILKIIESKNPKARIVLNAISLETLSEVLDWIKDRTVAEEEIVQVSVSKSRKIGNYHMMTGQNPIFIISFCLEGKEEEI